MDIKIYQINSQRDTEHRKFFDLPEGKAASCQGIGFQEVDFDQSAAHKPDDLLRILYVEPGKPAYEAELGCDLRLLQKAVQGYIEHVYLNDVILVCNEEGKLKGMPPNRKLESGEIIADPFFLVGEAGEDYVSLTDAQVQKYLQVFSKPQDISQDEMMRGFGYTIITF